MNEVQNSGTKFFFFFETEGNTTQTMAHITSAISILFLIDLLTDWNPLKTFVREFIPKLGGTKATTPATTTPVDNSGK